MKEESLLHFDNSDYDYIDSYKYTIIDKKNRIDIPEIVKAFAKPGPKWFEGLFSLRNEIASLFKLKTPAMVVKKEDNGSNKYEVGTQAGIFKVYGKTATEIILGEDDKHLDLRISLLLEQSKYNENEKKITVTTIVKLNNKIGKYYFFIIKPFHRTIVPLILKRNFKQLESEINA